MTLSRAGRFVDEPLPSLCEWVAHPEVPSPAGGTVVATCTALVTSLIELLVRVTKNRLHKQGASVEPFEQMLQEAQTLCARLLDYGEGDVYEAQKIIQGQRNACVRKDIGSPAKIAGTVVKVMRLAAALAEHVRPALYSDLRVAAFIAHGAVYGITEICYANIRLASGADDTLMERIAKWRQEADHYRERICAQTEGESEWRK